MRRLRLAALVFIAASVFAVGFVGVAAAGPVDLDPDTDLDGAGVDGDPYIITNASELQAIGNDLDAYYELGEDIDASETEEWNDGDGFEPIGDDDNRFGGTFTGDGYTISNLVIDSDEDETGLFGGTHGATITNVHLDAIDVSGGTLYTAGLVGNAVSTTVSDVSVQGSVSGNAVTGGVAGYVTETQITDTTVEVDVSGTSHVGGVVGLLQSGEVTRTTVSGTLTGSASYHRQGGVVGKNVGTVTESVASVDVHGGYNLGGLVGLNEGTVSHSHATGSVSSTRDTGSDSRGAGGLVGLNDGGTIEGSYAIGAVDAVDGVTTLGGLVGYDDGTVFDSYWDTQSMGQSASGGDGEGLTTVEMTGDRAEDSMDFDFEESWDVSEGDSANGALEYYPTLQNNPQDPAPNATLYADGNGEDDPYVIEDWYHLDNVRENLDANFTLANDLDTETAGYDDVADAAVNNGHGFESIGEDGEEFTGWFNGSEYTISNLTIDREEDVIGLFGYTDDATIEKVGLEDVDIHGQNYVGGLVGYNNGTISESYVTGDVKGSGDTVGGLISYNDGTVSESYATGTVDGNFVGGLVGYNTEGTVSESYATGTVDGTTAGGLVGVHDTESDVEGSYWDTETTGQDDSAGGGEGLTTDQMTGANATALMSGFEFPAESTEGSWHATDAYPALTWQDTQPFYGVNVTDTNAPVDEGEPLEVTATVTNWGADGDRTVELRDFDGDEQDTEAVTLVSGNSEKHTLQWDTAVSDAGTGSVTVTSGDHTDSEVVTVEAVPSSTGSGTSSSSTSVDGDGTTSVRTSGDELRADVTPSGSDGVSESHLEFSSTQAIELRFFTDDTAAEDGPIATTEQLDIKLFESIDTALTIRESNTPTTDDVRDLDQGLEAVGYLEIATDFEPDQLDSATIEFSAPTDALETADGDIDEVSLYHFDSDADEWQPLETTVLDSAGDKIRFSGAVDGFSQFGIGVGTPDVDDPGSSADETGGDEASDVDDDSGAGDTDRNGMTEDVDDGTPGFSVGITLLAIVVFLAAFGRLRGYSTHD